MAARRDHKSRLSLALADHAKVGSAAAAEFSPHGPLISDSCPTAPYIRAGDSGPLAAVDFAMTSVDGWPPGAIAGNAAKSSFSASALA
jgi:hypothetical protein